MTIIVDKRRPLYRNRAPAKDKLIVRKYKYTVDLKPAGVYNRGTKRDSQSLLETPHSYIENREIMILTRQSDDRKSTLAAYFHWYTAAVETDGKESSALPGG